jgi:hypothetical protein
VLQTATWREASFGAWPTATRTDICTEQEKEPYAVRQDDGNIIEHPANLFSGPGIFGPG